MKVESRPLWVLFLSLIIGTVSGFLFYKGLLINIPLLTDGSYRPPDQSRWVTVVSEAYQYNADEGQALRRLELLADDDPRILLQASLQTAFSSGDDAGLQALVDLYQGLYGTLPGPIVVSLTERPLPLGGTPSAPAPTATLENAPEAELNLTLIPTATTNPTGDYVLTVYDTSCEADTRRQVEVIVQDEWGNGIPGIFFTLLVDGDEMVIVTGLKPEVDPGYLDFDLDEQGTTVLTPRSFTGEALSLPLESCETENGEAAFLSYLLIFEPATE